MKKSRRMRWAAKALALCLTGATAFAGAAAFSPVTAEADSVIDGQTTTGSITITRQNDEGELLSGATYKIYKIMSLTPGSDGGYASYTIESEFATDLAGITPDDLQNYSAQEIEGRISALAATAAGITEDGTDTTEADGIASFTGLELGYYLVVETTPPAGYTAGSPFLIAVPSTNNYDGIGDGSQWVYDVEATPKNANISISKTLAAAEEGAEQDGTVAVNDYVKYQITTEIPSYPAEYFAHANGVKFEITDEMSSGLNIQNDVDHPVTVAVGADDNVAAGADTYTLSATPQPGEGADLTVSFVQSYIQAHPGETVTITYYAQVTENAVSGTAGNTNDVTLTYNNNPGQTTTTTPPEPVTVYSFDIQVEKFTEEAGTPTGSPLEGAEFELYADADLTEQIGQTSTTTAQGLINFELLDAGTYYLKETKAPAGYTLLADPIKVKITATDAADGTFTLEVNGQEVDETTGTYVSRIDAENGTAIIAVENYKGFTLPATGGMGIALFVIIGIAGIAAVSIVITKKTKKN